MIFLSFKKGVDEIMIKIIKQEIKISHELKCKVEWACKLNSTKPIFINGSLLKLEPTNIGYLEPHRAIINNKTYLFQWTRICLLQRFKYKKTINYNLIEKCFKINNFLV